MNHKKHRVSFVSAGTVLLLGAGGIYVLWTKKHAALFAPPSPSPLVLSSQSSSQAAVAPVPSTGSYNTFTITTAHPGAELAREVGAKNVSLVLAFNRLDPQHIPPHAVLTIPQTLDWDALSPFPSTLPDAAAIPKLFIVSQRVQAFGAYEYGTLVRWGVVSTGKASTPTPNKLYTANWKGRLVVSSIKDEWVMPWYFNLDNAEGVSMHQYDLPGYPASHACVRMLEADAEWVYHWADQWILTLDGKTALAPGTPVIVFGAYAYGQLPPWRQLPTNPEATTITVDELSKVVDAYLPTIKKDLEQRSEVERAQHQ
ncbi:MAG TPA: L,D-transpeptidase [Candidatus Paceibacterota bacterium]|nr:L,D-transpeptidase [Candidatus Paceibacterota bacterium]